MFVNTAYASDENPIGFSVETIMPDNQIDQNKNYFYIQTSPGANQILKVKVTGTSEEPVKIKAYIANAITDDSGTVDYKPNIEKDDTLVDSIEEIAKVDENEFELGLGEEKIVEISITSPATSYSGVKMGAVYFERVMNGLKEGKINNKYSYRIGIICSETEDLYTNSQEFNLLKVTPELKKTQKSVTLTLQNREPKTIADLYMDIKIVDKKTGKTVKSQKLSDGMVAPNSRFDYSVNWGIESIRSGTYIAKVSAKSRYKSWELEKEFEITADEAKKMNEETLYKLMLPLWAYIVTVILGLFTVGSTVFLALRRKKLRKKKKRGGKNVKNKRKTKKG